MTRWRTENVIGVDRNNTPILRLQLPRYLIMKLLWIDFGMKITDKGEDLSLKSEVSDEGFPSQWDMRKLQLWDQHLKTPTSQQCSKSESGERRPKYR
jgi:hypothetical protein